tara:strand:+ start:1500 stop:2402 length:903 start_codon:yes stop_codon:yes gene_type:complete
MDFKTTSSGKILMTSEYLVLKGALALAIPTRFKQSLTFIKKKSNKLIWKSYDSKNKIWFNCEFNLPNLQFTNSSNNKKGKILQSILLSAKKINPSFLSINSGGIVKTKLDFPNDWGLGSSSTLINNIAKWGNIDPYKLLWSNYKGSGYDIACAKSKTPLLYKLENSLPIIEKTSFNPIFSDNLFFIHMNKKQNTNNQIKIFNAKKISANIILAISELTKKFVSSNNLIEFQVCIKKHELLLSKELKSKPIKELLFKDYKGEIKSLGAWGGDFILAAGPLESPSYFSKKGFKTIIHFKKMF